MKEDVKTIFEEPIEKYLRLNPFQKESLLKLKIHKVKDLLYHFPTRYGDIARINYIVDLKKSDQATIFGKISNLKTSKAFYKKIPMSEATISDDTGEIKCVWFNQPYIAKMIKDGVLVRIDGKVSERKDVLYFSNPKIEEVSKAPIGVGDSLFGNDADSIHLYPVYPETKGISSNWFYHAIVKILSQKEIEKVKDPIPEEILKRYNLPSLNTALIWIHTPKNEDHALIARKRFSFEEIFYIQLHKNINRKENQKLKSYKIEENQKLIEEFKKNLGFKLTDAQEKASESVIKDLSKDYPMSRLIEGDVGSGKTAVAALATYILVHSRPDLKKDYGNLQIAYMVPTEILAKQHFENFIKYFIGTRIQIGLITGSGCQKFPSKTDRKKPTNISRAQLLKWVANGEIPVLIGTHALIQKSVLFKHLSLVIIDEQHRFGTEQRKKLAQKEGFYPHLLSMTATPIPRTLALTIYGDLDLTLIDQMPSGRKPIITEISNQSSGNRKDIYEKIRREIKAGRQVYIICPRIDEPDPDKESQLLAKSVKAEAERLKKEIFPEFEFDILHSKMKTAEKDKVMIRFAEGKTHILVATSVVEVGVNVPNATIILIEGAERFGLAQLHQLRGRVIRSNHQAYCYVFTESSSKKTFERLKALTQAKNGFELSEYDLQLRGAGALGGKKQWGISDLGMEAIKNIKMVEAARNEAKNIIEKDPDLKNFSDLKTVLQNRDSVHFE
jgi:ATP-dependent DNA helicase RecG